jgi:hypothetical protein
MKAATGELNLTLITILALGAVLAFFWVLWPSIKEKITGSTTDNMGDDPTAYVEVVETDLI